MPVRAFLVEDNPAIREGLVEALCELAGVQTCGVAANEQDAIAWLTDPSHAWDIAIVDLNLGPAGGSGFGVLRACRDRPAARRMVVLTGTAHPDVRRQCEALGSDGVFDKSMETDALVDWCRAQAKGAGA